MSPSPEQLKLMAEANYLLTIIHAIDEAGKNKQFHTHSTHVEHLPEVAALRETLDIQHIGLQARIRRIDVIGR